jgi:hypothetical protein
MTKEKTARLIPNAIQIITEGEKVSHFSAFARLIRGRSVLRR